MKKLAVVLTILFLTILVTSGIAGWFYWFQWRPSEIRKVCSQEAANKADSEVNKYIKALVPDKAAEEVSEKTDNYYPLCMRKYGLEP